MPLSTSATRCAGLFAAALKVAKIRFPREPAAKSSKSIVVRRTFSPYASAVAA